MSFLKKTSKSDYSLTKTEELQSELEKGEKSGFASNFDRNEFLRKLNDNSTKTN